jgi:putrescine---pyruvate transaminase
MGVFSVAIEVGNAQSDRFERVEAVVDTGASYTQLPVSTLRRLGVQPHTKHMFVMADGRRAESDIGRAWIRIEGRTEMTIVVFAEEGTQPLIGAVTLEEFGLGVDPIGKRLIPVAGYRLQRQRGLTTVDEAQRLIESDLEHQLHPQYHVRDHEQPIIFKRGEGALLYDINGREYIDGLSCLWNVAVGHGRAELADAAAAQMRELAFSNSYVGYANEPSIRLAEKLMSLVYPNMQAVLFSNSGSEAVEAAIKIARYFWYLQDRPEKVKIVARKEAYHGGTLGATAATGLPPFHKGFGPLPPAFVRAETCYPYRCGHCSGVEDCTLACADDIESVIIAEGPETVAAVIAEPVHGAGGVIVPAPGYWPRLREICDRHDVLLIADEVITGFGRTGRWFALEHWGTQPDMMSVAKAITSAYVPLAGTVYSKRIHDAIQRAPPDKKFMHGYTNAGHPTACAVGLRNLQIIEEEGLVQRAEEMGRYLLDGLNALREHPHVGDVRGLGLIAGMELVADKVERTPYDPSDGVGVRMLKEMRQRGLITRVKGDSILFAPPLIVKRNELDAIVSILEESVIAVCGV